MQLLNSRHVGTVVEPTKAGGDQCCALPLSRCPSAQHS